jgi:hypothetical protein
MFCITCNKLLSDERNEYDSPRNHLGHSIKFGDGNIKW